MPPISLSIIGAGPAGYECAVRAAKRGVQVTLIEEKSVGGVCLREGCIPTKCLCRTAELLDEINAAASFGGKAQIGFETAHVQFYARLNFKLLLRFTDYRQNYQ